MKIEQATILTLEEIISMNEEWMRCKVKGAADMCCAVKPGEPGAEKLFRFELTSLANAIASFPAKNADINDHIQFWLEKCSDDWYNTKCAPENQQLNTNVIVQFEKCGQTLRRWIWRWIY